MRIGIVGAGFFGHHIAEQFARQYPGVSIDIFEREARPLLGAGTTNQCRLHMGFHYPRSGYTIYQSIMGFDRFMAQYEEFVEDVPDNLYAVHRDGLVNADQYLAVMDSFSLPYEHVDVSRDLFTHPEEIDLLLRVPEKAIHVAKLRERLSERFDGTLHVNTRIDDVSPEEGILRSGPREFGPYDYIINATYTNPNLGLPEAKQFEIKWELTALVFAKTSLSPGTAITIMDGDYVSVYPAYGGRHTLSSVRYTPLRRYTEHEGLDADVDRRFEIAEREQTAQCIGEDVARFVSLDFQPEELWVTAKTKLRTDKGDSRVTEVRRHERVLSVLCGKIDAVFEASDAILREVT